MSRVLFKWRTGKNNSIIFIGWQEYILLWFLKLQNRNKKSFHRMHFWISITKPRSESLERSKYWKCIFDIKSIILFKDKSIFFGLSFPKIVLTMWNDIGFQFKRIFMRQIFCPKEYSGLIWLNFCANRP